MFSIPGYFPNMSMRLSSVLDDVGVNEKLVMRRRRANLLNEINDTISNAMLRDEKSTTYWLGSRTEGTTTPGLSADIDILTCLPDYNVIQDGDEMAPEALNLLMVKDKSTPPGYCHLQIFSDDVKYSVKELPSEFCVMDKNGHFLLKNTPVSAPVKDIEIEYKQDVHGPSLALSLEGVCDMDLVCAFPCSSWPKTAVDLSKIQVSAEWPTAEMLEYAVKSGCLLVPVGSNSGENAEIEWRVSTCLAERCMVFNLNITQIRCYVLMKMLLKSFININEEEQVSSFMCKTILLHLAITLRPKIWREENLFQCLTCALLTLQRCITGGYCPHVFIPENNLMAWRFSTKTRLRLKSKLADLIRSGGRSLLGIEIDEVGKRLLRNVNVLCRFDHNSPCSDKSNFALIAGSLYKDVSDRVNEKHLDTLAQIHDLCFSDEFTIDALQHCLGILTSYSKDNSELEKLAIKLLTPLLSSTLASVLASCSIAMNEDLPEEVFHLFSAGFTSDIASGRLKYASVLYSKADWDGVEAFLSCLQNMPEVFSAQLICGCYNPGNAAIYATLADASAEHSEEIIQRVTSLCVKFLPCEKNCIPKELQYEMFRSTGREIEQRLVSDIWMDWAVVDSLPYLYFLQYKTYGYLNIKGHQKQALTKLIETTIKDTRLRHRETALNLLGQCFEEEKRFNDALRCYLESLNLRMTNNIARVHICKLLSKCYQENVVHSALVAQEHCCNFL